MMAPVQLECFYACIWVVFSTYMPAGPAAMTNDGGEQLESARISATIYDVRTAEATKSNALREGGLGKPMGALGGGL